MMPYFKSAVCNLQSAIESICNLQSAILILLLAATAGAQLRPATITSVAPSGVQRGTRHNQMR